MGGGAHKGKSDSSHWKSLHGPAPTLQGEDTLVSKGGSFQLQFSMEEEGALHFESLPTP